MDTLYDLLAAVREADAMIMRHHDTGEHDREAPTDHTKCAEAFRGLIDVISMFQNNGWEVEDLNSLCALITFTFLNPDTVIHARSHLS